VFNIIIRTSNRPVYFWNCVRSVEGQTYLKRKILVGIDGNDTYANHYQPIRYNPVKSNRTYLKGAHTSMMHFPFNLYLNKLMRGVSGGWVIFLDDDDMFAHEDCLRIIREHRADRQTLILWRVNIAGRIIPSDENFGKRPVVKDISGIGFCFHSDYIPLLQWDSYKQCDWRVISRAYDILRPVWIDEVLTRTQRSAGDGFGYRKDRDF